MIGSLAQIVALVTYGNDFLKNGKLTVDFYPGNSTFQFCNRVDFKEIVQTPFSTNIQETPVADDPLNWLHKIKADGCNRLRLFFQHSQQNEGKTKDYKLAGMVGGGGYWYIEAVYTSYSDLWYNYWKGTQPDDPDQKVWSVTYGLTHKHQPIIDFQVDCVTVRKKLQRTLTDIANFAFRHDLEYWGKWYDNAWQILDSQNPEQYYYHKDLIPANYALAARRILFAAGTAWAFGGMGTWNDLSFPNKEENDIYEKLSERLYTEFNEAIITAINSY